MSYKNVVLSDYPIAYYKLDENTIFTTYQEIIDSYNTYQEIINDLISYSDIYGG